MSNKGIYSPKDTKFLMDMQQFTRLGQLELIQTQTASSANVDVVVSYLDQTL